MCGIAGIYVRSGNTKLNLDAILDTMLDEIADRGGDATGFLALNPEGVGEWQRAAVDVPDFIKYRRLVPKGTRIILAHTRWATQGHQGFMENNHPIRRGPFYVIHNGHVSNDWELFKLAGRERFGQVDTEAIPALLAHHGELRHVDKVMEEIDGAAAIAAVDERNPGELVLARGYSSPLNVLVTDKLVLWGSTERTVRMAYKKHIGKLPRRQKIESLPEGVMLFITEKKVERIEFKAYAPPTYNYAAGGYSAGRQYGEAWAWSSAKDNDSCSIPPAQIIGDGHFWNDDDDDDEMEWKAEDVLDRTQEHECDECGGRVPLMDIIRVPEPDGDGFEWKLCEDCADLWEKLADEEWTRANQASLDLIDKK
jgi:Glutamine amidotransferase domain